MTDTDYSQHGSEESYFVSMTDLMVGMLFIFIIMLMAFALNMRQQQDLYNRTTDTLTQANVTRTQLLRDIKRTMEKQGVKVIIDPENGILRLPEQLLFARGKYVLKGQGRIALKKLAGVLSVLLPCYTRSPVAPARACPPNPGGHIEAIFIEGHTDNQPILGMMANGIRSNWQLSTARAIATFRALVSNAPILNSLKNTNNESILGVSGYGDTRPAVLGTSKQARAANRRIDLRFLMATPNQHELEKIQRSVSKGMRSP